MEYFLIWIPAGFAALGLLYLLTHAIEKATRIEWPKHYLNHLVGWLALILIWVGMSPFILVGLLLGYRPAFESPNERAAPGSSPTQSKQRQ